MGSGTPFPISNATSIGSSRSSFSYRSFPSSGSGGSPNGHGASDRRSHGRLNPLNGGADGADDAGHGAPSRSVENADRLSVGRRRLGGGAGQYLALSLSGVPTRRRGGARAVRHP